jgi:Gluconate 2-dehydrogenase subunit 3
MVLKLISLRRRSRDESPLRGGSRHYSRAEVLKRAGFAGAAISLPFGVGTRVAKSSGTSQEAAPKRVGALNASQLGTLEAIAARLVPTDANGPGAVEAGAANFINLQLAGFPSERNSLIINLPDYTAGLAATDAYAQAKKGAAFASLSPADQDAVLTDMQNNVATGSFNTSSATFFNLVRSHTLMGMFCDPYYGGNQNFVGWILNKYPGVRMPVKPADTRLSRPPELNRISAYSIPQFKPGPPTIKG